MFDSAQSTTRIGIYGAEAAPDGRGVGLWAKGYHAAVIAAGANPSWIERFSGDDSWSDLLDGLDAVVLAGWPMAKGMGDEESLCCWCKEHKMPLLAVDQGMLALNSAFGGCNYLDLARELPEALQHRHPPEPGVRHAILIEPGTLLADLFGEGEIVVNSEHRQAVCRLAQGFRVTARALDGVIEAIEYRHGDWFALGVQWQPASGTASGLDIQVFRCVIDAALPRREAKPARPARRLAASA